MFVSSDRFDISNYKLDKEGFTLRNNNKDFYNLWNSKNNKNFFFFVSINCYIKFVDAFIEKENNTKFLFNCLHNRIKNNLNLDKEIIKESFIISLQGEFLCPNVIRFFSKDFYVDDPTDELALNFYTIFNEKFEYWFEKNYDECLHYVNIHHNLKNNEYLFNIRFELLAYSFEKILIEFSYNIFNDEGQCFFLDEFIKIFISNSFMKEDIKIIVKNDLLVLLLNIHFKFDYFFYQHLRNKQYSYAKSNFIIYNNRLKSQNLFLKDFEK